MTSAQVRQSFLDFFQSKQHSIVPVVEPDAGLPATCSSPTPGMNQFVPIFLGERRTEVRWAVHAPGPRRRHPEVHPRRRQAQRPRGRRPRHLPPHVLRDAGQLVASATTSRREAIDCAWELIDRGLEVPAAPPLRHRLQARTSPRATRPSSTRKPGTSGPRSSAPRASTRPSTSSTATRRITSG
jgi:hypothetical protein